MKKAFSYIFLLTAFLHIKAFAGVEPAVTTYLDGKYFIDYTVNGSRNPDYVASGASYVNFLSGFYLNPAGYQFSSDYTIRKVENMLQLYLNPDLPTYIDFPYTLEVEVEINQYKTGATSISTMSKTLKINFDPKERTKWIEKANFHFEDSGYTKYTVRRVTATSNGSPLTDNQKALVAKVVGLRSDVVVERYKKFDPNNRLYLLADLSHSYDATTNELIINWKPIDGAELYDLEYAFIDTYDGAGGTLWPGDLKYQQHFDLDRNSTRVQLAERTYKIPLVYEKGIILYRVRGIGKVYDPASDKVFLVPGKWSNPYNNLPNGPEQCSTLEQPDCDHTYQINAAHERDKKNWQITTSYAEEGKRKDVISYLDGTYRNRQSITGLSTDRMTLIGESIYDFQGRASINVLPVPVNDPHLKYYESLNQSSTGIYSRADFDLTKANCDINPSPMSTVSGASRYYSPANPDKADEKAFIPDAEGFPFVQTEFTQDNTGRVRRQSGVGLNHKLGSGHETEYFYGTAAQEELSMLFGVEVGVASHYKKNVARDPNGQLSVSMLDLKGNIIATALAGTPPENLEALDSYKPYLMSIDLLAFNQSNTLDNSLTASRAFTVTTESKYDFEYSISQEAYRVALCDGLDLCFDCVYDLEVELVDNYNCDKVYYSQTRTIGPFSKDSNGDIIINDACNGDNVEFNSISFPKPFSVLLPVGSYTITKKLTVNQEVADAYVNHYLLQMDSLCTIYDDILAENLTLVDSSDCFIEEPGDNQNQCELAREGMLADVSPHGQYGQIDIVSYSSADPTSVFFGTQWKNPLNGGYKDEFGNTATIYDPVSGTQIGPQSATLEQFIENWQDSWAEALLPYHPEKCYLKWCENIPDYNGRNSWDLDMEMGETEHYNTAATNGYFSPLSIDPYFQTGSSGSSYSSQMNNSFLNYNGSGKSMKQLAVEVVFNKYNLPLSGVNAWITANSTSSNDPKADEIWTTFLALYKSKKEEFQYKDRTDYALNTCKGYNECIGANPFNWTKNSFGSLNPLSGRNEFINGNQPCSLGSFAAYANKTKRFSSIYDASMPFDPYNVNNLDSLGNWALESQNDFCKSCRCETDFQTLINGSITTGLIKNGVITPTTSPRVLTSAFLTKLNALRPSVNFGSLKFFNFYSNGDLEMQISMDDGLSQCSIIIKEGGFEWPSVSSISCPVFSYAPGETIMSADIEVTLYDGSTHNSRILVECSNLFEPCNLNHEETCPPTDEAKELAAVFNKLIASNELTSGGSVKEQFGPKLYNYFYYKPTFFQYPITIWEGTQSGNTINGKINNGQKICDFTLTLPAGINTSDLGSIISITPDNTTLDANTGYTYGATLNTALRNGLGTVEIKLTNSCFPMSYCLRCPPGGLILGSTTGSPVPIPNPTPSTNPPTRPGRNGVLANPRKVKNQRPGAVGIQGNTGQPNGSNPSRIGVLIDPRQAVNQKQTGLLRNIHDPNKLCDDCDPAIFNTTFERSNFKGGAINSGYTATGGCDLCNMEVDSAIIIPIPNPCLEEQILAAYTNTYNTYQQYKDSVAANLRTAYNRHCLGAMEKFNVSYTDDLHHFTLYYYDQANNLVQTVPPEGVDKLNITETAQAINYMKYGTGSPITPSHIMRSEYTYNSLNQLREQSIPDHIGETRFWYDYLSRIVASQNPEQRANKQYSYSLYDELGRVVEAGVLNNVTQSMTDALAKNQTALTIWVNTFKKTEITRSVYDAQDAAISMQHFNGDTDNYRGRIASVQYFDTDGPKYTNATHYKYDIHGNVEALVQDIDLLEPKKMTYAYDLISGNVNEVNYQPGALDQFIQRYAYDADNRLITAQSSFDGKVWDTEAEYYYYAHGPLARVELGEHKVQGIDYAYTIQGWIKGVNAATLNYKTDIGHDGADLRVARDVSGYMLRYFTDDYKSIGNQNWEPEYRGTGYHRAGKDLFNGNIQSMITAIAPMKNGQLKMGPQGYAFDYDQLNRIKASTVYKGLDANSNRWIGANSIKDYATAYSFDANGNLLSLLRNGTTQGGKPLEMDDFSYQYIPGTNKLDYVKDAVADSNYDMDIDNQNPGNYEYDGIGNLVRDHAESMRILWNVSGKVKAMKNTKGELSLSYGPMGNRVRKLFTEGLNKKQYTFYVLDATGNVMATYTTNNPKEKEGVKWESAYIYGSSRLAEERTDTTMYDLGKIKNVQDHDYDSYRSRGSKYYELTEHRNNVLATISDRRLAVDDNADKETEFFEADIWTVSQYYPFGKMMPENHEESHTARFGFNGMEKDDELRGTGNSYTTEFRQYNVDLGRWLSIDPVIHHNKSSYVSFDNNPVFNTDVQGADTDPPKLESGIKVSSTAVVAVNPENISEELVTIESNFIQLSDLSDYDKKIIQNKSAVESPNETKRTNGWSKGWTFKPTTLTDISKKQMFKVLQKYKNIYGEDGKIKSTELISEEVIYLGYELSGYQNGKMLNDDCPTCESASYNYSYRTSIMLNFPKIGTASKSMLVEASSFLNSTIDFHNNNRYSISAINTQGEIEALLNSYELKVMSCLEIKTNNTFGEMSTAFSAIGLLTGPIGSVGSGIISLAASFIQSTEPSRIIVDRSNLNKKKTEIISKANKKLNKSQIEIRLFKF